MTHLLDTVTEALLWTDIWTKMCYSQTRINLTLQLITDSYIYYVFAKAIEWNPATLEISKARNSHSMARSLGVYNIEIQLGRS